ncbi:MAG: Crp/Fnr family transcriptional regulator [Leptospirales bacterium]|jgi:CRP-like cAMP-binding protein
MPRSKNHPPSDDSPDAAYACLRETMRSYAPIGDGTWTAFRSICGVRRVQKGEALVRIGEVPRSLFFVYAGLFRAFMIGGANGEREVNKNFFEEGRFPASVAALLTGSESEFCIAALEDSIVVEIDHAAYRRLLARNEELKTYHIAYLEKHWVLEKEPQEVALLQDDAKVRYADFIKYNPDLARRIPLHHIASRIGVTPTQLSRIRNQATKKAAPRPDSQHM